MVAKTILNMCDMPERYVYPRDTCTKNVQARVRNERVGIRLGITLEVGAGCVGSRRPLQNSITRLRRRHDLNRTF